MSASTETTPATHLATGKPLLRLKGQMSPENWKPLTHVVAQSSKSHATEFANENALQEVLHEHPSVLPVKHFWKSSDDWEIVSLGREIQLRSTSEIGMSVDNIYLTRSGKLVIVEAKLFRNHEQRRKVVSQIIEYAAQIAQLTLESFEQTLKTSKQGVLAPANQAPQDGQYSTLEDFYRAHFPNGRGMQFVDDFAMQLQRGEFLLLIVGDGILAHSIGYGEALPPDESLTRALSAAHERLNTVPQASREEVVESLVWDGRKEAVIKAIEDEDPNDLIEALDHVEDLLAVARALDLREQVDHFVEELDPVLAWISAEMFPALIPFVDANLERYVENVPLGRLWRNLQGHAWRSILQTTAPVDASAEAFMASMFSEPWYIRLANQIRARATDVAKTVLSELEETVKSASFLPLQPKLGVSTKFAIKMRQWHDQSHHARLFVVDAGYPEGYEVTDDWLNGPTIWEYESDLDLVLLVSTSPISGEKLVDCLSYASQRKDIWVQYHHMSRNPDHVA